VLASDIFRAITLSLEYAFGSAKEPTSVKRLRFHDERTFVRIIVALFDFELFVVRMESKSVYVARGKRGERIVAYIETTDSFIEKALKSLHIRAVEKRPEDLLELLEL